MERVERWPADLAIIIRLFRAAILIARQAGLEPCGLLFQGIEVFSQQIKIFCEHAAAGLLCLDHPLQSVRHILRERLGGFPV